jgi:hypothetical protein
MRIANVHKGVMVREGAAFASSWVFMFSWLFASSWIFVFAQPPLPVGAVSIVNQDRIGTLVALCADTGEPAVQLGAKKIRNTGVWAGKAGNLQRIQAGLGACDPAWSPDGRRLAVTAAQGLWVFPANSSEGSLRVESRLPFGGQSQFQYRAFSQPEWSPDGLLVAVVVSNGRTSWVEVFEASSGRLFYTSPPDNSTFSWSGARELKLGKTEVQLPTR